MSDFILAGDIGGTKTNLAVYARQGQGEPSCMAEGSYRNREFVGIEEIIHRFIEDAAVRLPDYACFGVAGAVRQGVCMMPNLGWRLEETALARNLGMRRVALLNDLVATAHGIAALPPDKLVSLHDGNADRGGNKALIAAGTGLGEAILFETDHGLHVSASEGGHADFAPRNEEEIELWRHLAARFDHVSVERLVSGPGLCNIYAFLRDSGRLPEPPWLKERLDFAADASAAIAELALHEESPLCRAALHHFVSIYGAEAGNLALKALATGGVYVGGGIAPKILNALQTGAFLESFQSKGRFAGMLAQVPVKVILEPKTALLGAACYGLH